VAHQVGQGRAGEAAAESRDRVQTEHAIALELRFGKKLVAGALVGKIRIARLILDHVRGLVAGETGFQVQQPAARLGGGGLDAAEALAASAVPPYEVVEGDYNAMSNAGIDALLLLLVGGGGTAFNNSNAYLGVGDSTDSFDAADTDLQASSNKVRKAMSASFPATGTHLQTFKSVFDGSSGNFAWNEWAIFNASSSGTMLNRKVESLGTKASGSWSLAVTFALA